MQTRNSSKKLKSNLISATRISNFVKSDPIVDYLDLLNEKKLTLSNDLTVSRKRSRSFDLDDDDKIIFKKKKSSFDYIVESGNIFEYDIIKQIELLMKENNELKKLIKINEPDIYLNCTLTMEIIKENKHNIILGSVLINKLNYTWGKPDLIVKGCWIKKYIQENIVDLNLNKWYIIDIKSSTINLINGGEDISSKLLYNVYKSQVYIYTDALNNLMKENKISNDVTYGFILGRRYKYTLNKNTIIKKPFDCLGIINFQKDFLNGVDWKNIVKNGVNWINDLRSNWEKFSVNPINKNELYPNMKNNYDKNWHKVKKQIALVNKEITLLWNCGMFNRNMAWEKGIKRYDDPRLNSNILGFASTNSNRNIIIDKMLQILHTKNNYILDKKNNYLNWQNKTKWEFYVDFETYSPDAIYDENNDWDNCFYSNQKIYMIGVSWYSENKLNHKCFLLNYSNSNILKKEFEINKQYDNVKFEDCIFCSNEIDIITNFKNFILEFKPNDMDEKKFIQESRLYHWSGAEPIIFNKKISEHNFPVDKYRLNWFDLLQVFKYDNYPIIVKECFGFGLKEIAKKLNEFKQINLSWSELDDGLLSSFIARDIYIGINLNSNNEMYNIIEYNYIDCKALFKILEWMRKTIIM